MSGAAPPTPPNKTAVNPWLALKDDLVAHDSLNAALRLINDGYFRSSVSRSYYAMYWVATSRIVSHLAKSQGRGIVFSPYNRNNPAHDKVAGHLETCLTQLPKPVRDELADDFRLMRLFRTDADYIPNANIGHDDAVGFARVAAAFLLAIK